MAAKATRIVDSVKSSRLVRFASARRPVAAVSVIHWQFKRRAKLFCGCVEQRAKDLLHNPPRMQSFRDENVVNFERAASSWAECDVRNVQNIFRREISGQLLRVLTSHSARRGRAFERSRRSHLGTIACGVDLWSQSLARCSTHPQNSLARLLNCQ